jgi:hypothetical protein
MPGFHRNGIVFALFATLCGSFAHFRPRKLDVDNQISVPGALGLAISSPDGFFAICHRRFAIVLKPYHTHFTIAFVAQENRSQCLTRALNGMVIMCPTDRCVRRM